MAIKYEIHYLPNAGGEGETRRFAHIFEEPAMKDEKVIERLAKYSCIGKAEASAVLINHKLIDRACRIFIERHPEYADKYEEVKNLILKAGSVKKAEGKI